MKWVLYHDGFRALLHPEDFRALSVNGDAYPAGVGKNHDTTHLWPKLLSPGCGQSCLGSDSQAVKAPAGAVSTRIKQQLDRSLFAPQLKGCLGKDRI